MIDFKMLHLSISALSKLMRVASFATASFGISLQVFAADIQSFVDNINVVNIENHVIALASSPRFSEQELAIAEAYITTELQAYGYTVTREELFSPGVPSFGFPARNSANLVAELTGSTYPDEIFIVGAHFDTVPNSPGADDNAVSVAGMLEIARVLATQDLAKTIRFVAFTFEEANYLGSDSHALNARNTNENIIGMFSLEMIGYTCDEANCQVEFKDDPSCPSPNVLPYGACVYTPSDCIQVKPPGVSTGERIAITVNLPSTEILHNLTRARERHVDDLEIFVGEVLGDGSCYPDTQRSDHKGFWQQNYPALMLNDTGPFRNHNYHTDLDIPASLDFTFASKVTKLALATVLTFVEPDTKLEFHGVTAPAFVDRGFGPDGKWLTADDYFFPGLNPTGAVSGFRLQDPQSVNSDAFLGSFEDFSFYLKSPLKLGTNSIEIDTATVYVTTFSDESTQTLTPMPVLHTLQGILENPPMETQTLTLNADNTFTRSRRYRYRGSFAEFPVVAEISGTYLIRGQTAASVFAASPDLAATYDSIVDGLPTDWQIVFIDSFITAEPSAPQFRYNNVAAFYSTDPNVISELDFLTSTTKIPFPMIALLPLGGLMLTIAIALTRK